VAERLAAHRERRAAEQAAMAQQEAELAAERRARRESSRHTGKSSVKDAVAARYQQSQSYREFLAAEAERALQQAQAEAEIAARNAQAMADAQEQLLAELEQWSEPASGPQEVINKTEVREELAHELADIVMGAQELMAEPRLLTVVETAPVALTVHLGNDLTLPRHDIVTRSSLLTEEPENAAELSELDQEIEFRHSPEFAPHVIETQPIPANIIEFPRQLIAPRKARPRREEGPLREEFEPEPQLRIFEVEPEQIATTPLPPADVPTRAAEWQSLLLESAATAPTQTFDAHSNLAFQPQAAPMGQRLMAAAVDLACIGLGFVAFATVVGYMAGPHLQGVKLPLLGAGVAGTLAIFFLAYQMLFFTLADATPGMRYARIALCTFGDDNPTRKAMRRRTLAMVLAACPLGLGLAWAFMDNDRLGWHDRMSRMYQRAY